jgi:hypothetical protein
MQVSVDGGIRRRLDVFKAWAIGADAVGIARAALSVPAGPRQHGLVGPARGGEGVGDPAGPCFELNNTVMYFFLFLP